MNESFSRKLIESLPIGFASSRICRDSGGNIVDTVLEKVNNRFLSMLGAAKKDLIGQSASAMIQPEELKGWLTLCAEAADLGKTREYTGFSERFNRWCRISAFAHEKDHREQIVILLSEVSEQSEDSPSAESVAGLTRFFAKELDIAFNRTQDAMALLRVDDDEFRYLFSNKAYEKMTGYKPEHVLGKTPTQLHGERVGAMINDNLRKYVAMAKDITVEEALEMADGWRHFVTSYSLIFEGGRVAYLLLSRIDTTELQKIRTEREDLTNRLQSMFYEHNAVMLILEPDSGRILEANPAASKFYGYTKEELLNMSIHDINRMTKEELDQLLKKALHEQQQYFVFPHSLKNGETRLVDVYSSPITYQGSKQLFCIIFDVTERENLREELSREKELLGITLDSIGDGVVTTDMEGVLTSCNHAACKISGWGEEEILGKPFSDIFILKNEDTGEPIINPIQRVMETGGVVMLMNHTVLMNKTDFPIPIADSAAPIKDDNGKMYGVVMVFRDVSREKQHREQILYLGYHDALTGLYNRRFLEEKLKRYDSDSMLPIALIMGDVNGLKITNDVFGHEAGDRLLRQVADTFKEVCRRHDIVARWGGDEFLLVLPQTSFKSVQGILSRIRRSFEEKSQKKLQISVAMGCAVKSKPSEDLNRVLQEAEERMYHQKLLEGKSYRNGIINTLLTTLYEKNMETREHSDRLRDYCHLIGRELHLSTEEMDELSLLAMLHDIGKVGISQDILMKPGALNESEWAEIRRHPEIGYRIALSSPELAIVADFILSHHERWDGKGYPRGLKGTQIPLLCRILIVADSYDAMTSDRVYRKAMRIDEAVEELRRNAGTQFDEEIVTIFTRQIMDSLRS